MVEFFAMESRALDCIRGWSWDKFMGVTEEAGPSKHVSPALGEGVLEYEGTPIGWSALVDEVAAEDQPALCPQ